MTGEMRPHDACDLEDRILSAFLDGEPAEDLPEVAVHLKTCPRCARALDQARSLDALLASQTRTDMTEESADRILDAVFDAEETSLTMEEAVVDHGVRRISRRKRIAFLAASVVVFAVGLPMLWFLGKALKPGEGPDSPEPPSRLVATALDPVPGLKEMTTGIALPMGAAFTWTKKREFTRQEVKTCLEGQRISGLSRQILTAHVLRILDPKSWAKGEAVSPIGGPLTPGQDLALLASRWLLSQVRRGLMTPDRCMMSARILLLSRGKFRREMVDLLRSDARFTRQLASMRREDRRQGEPIALVGALGCRDQVDRLQGLPDPDLKVCVTQARETGDHASLAFLVDLYLESASRYWDIRLRGSTWFEGLPPEAEKKLSEILEDRVQSSRRKGDRDLCRKIHGRLCRVDKDPDRSTRTS